jgi:hypothetical protein
MMYQVLTLFIHLKWIQIMTTLCVKRIKNFEASEASFLFGCIQLSRAEKAYKKCDLHINQIKPAVYRWRSLEKTSMLSALRPEKSLSPRLAIP